MWALLAVMFSAGVLGGLINYFMARESEPAQPDPAAVAPSIWRNLIIGLGAALLVPLFLNMISSDLIELTRGTQDKPAQPYKIFVFAGFCLVASISSRAFIRTLSERILSEVRETERKLKKVEKKADAATVKVEEAEENFSQLHSGTELGNAFRHFQQDIDARRARFVKSGTPEMFEPAESVQAQPEVSEKETRILNAIADSGYQFRTARGLANDTGLEISEIEKTLGGLWSRELVDQRNGKKGTLWYVKRLGREAISARHESSQPHEEKDPPLG